MPQGRRKIPFSGKAKKVQLQAKKEDRNDPKDEKLLSSEKTIDQNSDDNKIPSNVEITGRKRYELRFQTEDRMEIERIRRELLKPIADKMSELEASVDEMFPEEFNFPIRPEWSKKMSKASFDANEQKYFREYVDKLFTNEKNLGFFELNLETWRQLWRVLEMSDVLLLVVDARYVPAMCPPSLINYVIGQNKDVIIVLNKVDLIPPSLSVAWKEYLESKFIGAHVTFFTSCPSYNLRGISVTKSGMQIRKMRGNISMVTEGAQQIFNVCQKIVHEKKKSAEIDLGVWEEKIKTASHRDGNLLDSHQDDHGDNENAFTIGMVGQPNAGKSSLINSLMGKKVVSVSKTPGHTKHFQTIFITKSIKLCDCPGLVFPSITSKQLQILMGSYPIPQVKEPGGTVMYIAERVDLPTILGLKHPSGKVDALWTPRDVSEAWAIKRGYMTAKSNRPDIYRAANHILRMSLEGKITLMMTPPHYQANKSKYEEKLDDIFSIKQLLGETNEQVTDDEEEEEDSEDEDEKTNDEDEEESTEKTPMKITNKFSALMEENDSD